MDKISEKLFVFNVLMKHFVLNFPIDGVVDGGNPLFRDCLVYLIGDSTLGEIQLNTGMREQVHFCPGIPVQVLVRASPSIGLDIQLSENR